MRNLFQHPRLVWSLALLLAAAAIFGYWRFGRAVETTVVPARQGSVALQVTGPGTVQARNAVSLASRLTTTVTEVRADVGDMVVAGQLLVLLDSREASARLAALRSQQQALGNTIEASRASVAKAQAELVLAQSRQRRDTELRTQGFLSAAALDTSAAGLQVAQSGLASAQATLSARQADAATLAQEVLAAETAASHTRLLAPMAGMVVQRLAEPGSTVGVGSSILKLVDPTTLWVATRVDESVIGQVAVGQQARILLRSGEALAGQVTRIAHQSDAATRELDVFVSFQQPPRHFAIDQEAAVTIETGQANGLVVPASALTKDRQGQTGVLVVRDGRSVFQRVSANGTQDGWVRVVDGLNNGDLVVRDSQSLRANQPVRPVTAP